MIITDAIGNVASILNLLLIALDRYVRLIDYLHSSNNLVIIDDVYI